MSRLEERIENFNRAFELFKRTRSVYLENPDDMYRLALAQCFEICYELSWKIMKDYLAIKGKTVTTPNDTFKTAFASEFLPNAQIWIDMTKDRNFSSHEYNLEKFNEVIDKIGAIYYNTIEKFYYWTKEVK